LEEEDGGGSGGGGDDDDDNDNDDDDDDDDGLRLTSRYRNLLWKGHRTTVNEVRKVVDGALLA